MFSQSSCFHQITTLLVKNSSPLVHLESTATAFTWGRLRKSQSSFVKPPIFQGLTFCPLHSHSQTAAASALVWLLPSCDLFSLSGTAPRCLQPVLREHTEILLALLTHTMFCIWANHSHHALLEWRFQEDKKKLHFLEKRVKSATLFFSQQCVPCC